MAAMGLPNGSIAVLRFIHRSSAPVTEAELLDALELDGAELYAVLERFEKAGWTEHAAGAYVLSERGAWVAESAAGG